MGRYYSIAEKRGKLEVIGVDRGWLNGCGSILLGELHERLLVEGPERLLNYLVSRDAEANTSGGKNIWKGWGPAAKAPNRGERRREDAKNGAPEPDRGPRKCEGAARAERRREKAKRELSVEHYDTVLKPRGVSWEVAQARGYYSRGDKLMIPNWLLNGQSNQAQSRLSKPDGSGDYKFARGWKPRLDTLPDRLDLLSNPKIPLFFPESVIKGDAMVSLFGREICVIEQSGVYGHRTRSETGGKISVANLDFQYLALNGRNVYLCPDSDVAINPMVHEATKNLRNLLLDRNDPPTVKIILLPKAPDGSKWGLDDYLAANSKITLNDLLALAVDEVDPPENEDRIAPSYKVCKMRLEERFGYIGPDDVIWDFRYNRPKKIPTFCKGTASTYRFFNKKGELKSGPDEWLCDPDRRTLEGRVLVPGGARPVTADNQVNLWQGWAAEPLKGDLSLYFALRDYVFMDQFEAAKRFDQWAGWGMAHPERHKQNTAFLVWGKHGIGKDLLGRAVGVCYGAHYLASVGDEQLNTRFNALFDGALFVHAEEPTNTNNRGLVNKIKKLITGHKLPIEHKGFDPFLVDNLCNMYYTSNTANGLYIERTERRFYVVESLAPEKSLPPKLAKDYAIWLDTKEGVAALLHYFIHEVDYTGYDPMAPAPETDALRVAQESTMGDMSLRLQGILEGNCSCMDGCEGLKEGDVHRLDDIAAHLPADMRRKGDETSLSNHLKENFGAWNVGKVKLEGKSMRLWVVRNVARWRKCEKTQIAAEYRKHHPWDSVKEFEADLANGNVVVQ